VRIGIDLGGTKTEGVVLSDQGEIIHRLRRATPQAEGYNAVLDNIAQLIAELETKAGMSCSVGIGTPGSLSPDTALMRNSNTLCLNGQPALADLNRLLARDIRIANDANCFALSEATYGAAAGAEVVFGVILGTGTGGGIVINGKLIHGAQHIAGEWGHNPLAAENRPCYCGRLDCVETYLSGSGLVQTWHRAGGEGEVNAREIVTLASEGDDLALTTLDHYHAYFARALANVINILDPDVVVLGGGLSNIESLYDKGAVALEQHIFSDTMRTRIVKSKHGDSSGVRGAAWLWDAP
jgi:fructokinase